MRSHVPVVTVEAACLSPDGEFALIRRLDREGREGWALPGGRVDLEEALADAVLRHVEADLPGGYWELPRTEPVAVIEYRSSADARPRDTEQHSVSIVFVARGSGELNYGAEVIDAKWFPLDQLPANSEFAFDVGDEVRRVAHLVGVS